MSNKPHPRAATPPAADRDGGQAACPFCSPPADRIVTKNSAALAITDSYPATQGHVLVVPRRHKRSVADMTWWEIFCAIRLLRKLYRAAQGEVDGFNFGVNDREAAGQSEEHAHIHSVPRRYGDQPDSRFGIRRGLPGLDKLAAPRPSDDD
ncbi:HIT family protein [Actinoallomurus acanthiterrae]